jgi:hypothetical protein
MLDDAADVVQRGSDSPPYSSPVNRFLPSFASDRWTCMPLPLSPTSGLGMKVAVLP